MIGGFVGRGFALGIGAAAPLGPVNIEIIRRSMLIHPLSGAALGAGAVSADVIYIALTYGGTAALITGSPVASAVLGFAGAAFLLYLGILALRSGLDRAGTSARLESARLTATGHAASVADDEGATTIGRRHVLPLRHYGIGLGMTLLNPYTIAYWLAVSSEVVRVSDGGGWRPLAALALGVVLGAGGWVVFLTSTIAAGRRFVGVRFLMAVSVLGGLVLMGFAAWQFGRLAGEFLIG